MDKICGDRFGPFEGVLAGWLARVNKPKNSSRVWIGLSSPCRVLKDSTSLFAHAVVTVCAVSAKCEALEILNTYSSYFKFSRIPKLRNFLS